MASPVASSLFATAAGKNPYKTKLTKRGYPDTRLATLLAQLADLTGTGALRGYAAVRRGSPAPGTACWKVWNRYPALRGRYLALRRGFGRPMNRRIPIRTQ